MNTKNNQPPIDLAPDSWVDEQIEEMKQRAGFTNRFEEVMTSPGDPMTLFDLAYAQGIPLSEPLLSPEIMKKIPVKDIFDMLPKGPLIGEQIRIKPQDEKDLTLEKGLGTDGLDK